MMNGMTHLDGKGYEKENVFLCHCGGGAVCMCKGV